MALGTWVPNAIFIVIFYFLTPASFKLKGTKPSLMAGELGDKVKSRLSTSLNSGCPLKFTLTFVTVIIRIILLIPGPA